MAMANFASREPAKRRSSVQTMQSVSFPTKSIVSARMDSNSIQITPVLILTNAEQMLILVLLVSSKVITRYLS